MSNMVLAQTTQPDLSPTMASWLLLGLSTAVVASGQVILRKRLYVVPAIPEDRSTPSAALLFIAMMVSGLMFVATNMVCGQAMGITQANSHELANMRKLMFCQPAAQLLTAGTALLMLAPYMPRALSWRLRDRQWLIDKALWGYLLAIPWVFLTGVVVTMAVGLLKIEVKTQHVIFELWRTEPAGVTSFKAVAFLSAVVGAPVAEELVFRGLLQRLVHRVSGNVILAVVVGSVAFALTHQPWTTQPPVFVLSLFLGWIFFRSGSLLTAMYMHAIFNLMQFAYFVFIVTR